MTMTSMGIVAFCVATLAIVGCPEVPATTEPLGGSETGADDPSDGTSGVGDGDGDGDGDGGNYGVTEFGDSTDTNDTCGDFAVQIDEECDDWNLAFETCKSLGFAGGELGCHDDCTFDTSGCFAVGCGNGIIEDPELCDGTPYPCWLLGYAGGTEPDGMASCGNDCLPDESTCSATCDWGDSGCFCWPNTVCPVGEECLPHPLFPMDGPGTCGPPPPPAPPAPPCLKPGEFCVANPAPTMPDCCPGLACVDGECVP
jgi:hypothetical protein